jgi:hypothetical protein
VKDLFGNDIKPKDLVYAQKGQKKSVQMHQFFLRQYGTAEGQKCKACKNLVWKDGGTRMYPKCRLSGLFGSTPNQDWSSTWPACGKFEIQDQGEKE